MLHLQHLTDFITHNKSKRKNHHKGNNVNNSNGNEVMRFDDTSTVHVITRTTIIHFGHGMLHISIDLYDLDINTRSVIGG